jgi:glyoxylase-like metal-dependent hydrolase (beta-lactamase superfamily II)
MIEEPEPGLRLIRAPNAGPMTFTGTNTWLLGKGPVAVIDPGPDDGAHLAAILAAAGSVSHILVTHAHLDHSALASRLRDATGAPVLAFGDAVAGRSARMQALAEAGLSGGGEGVDLGFRPDRRLAEGARIEGAGWQLRVLHLPGHFAGHLGFLWDDRLFCGDLVMGWASTLISPPDGDLARFLTSVRRLRGMRLRRLYPGHGDPVDQVTARLDWLLAHRKARSDAIWSLLSTGPHTVPALTRSLYRDTPPSLMRAAERNVFAHLIDLIDRNMASAEPDLSPEAVYRRLQEG